MIVWPSWRSGSSSSSAVRIWATSISMWLNAGVPSVSTMWSASAAAWSRGESSSRPESTTRSSSSCVPVSWNGMSRSSPIARSTAGSLSMPTTFRPRSAKLRASGRPIRPSPTMATLVATDRTLGGLPPELLSQELPREAAQERGVVVEVARQEATRLLRDPVGPLEAAILHPRRRLRDPPGVEVERRADGAHDRHLEPLAHAGHPLLLTRHAGPDPQHVRPVAIDQLHDLVLLVRLEVAERGRVAAHDPQTGEVAPQVQRQLRQRALVAAAVEPDAVPLCGAAARVAAHQLGPVDAVREVLAQQVHRPHERHPVGHGERRPEQRLAHLG